MIHRMARTRGGSFGEQGTPEETPLEEQTKEELYEQATDLEVEGRSTMDKGELAQAVAEAKPTSSGGVNRPRKRLPWETTPKAK